MSDDPYTPGVRDEDTSTFVMPDDFKAWAKTLRDAPRRALSIHELREIWKERQAAIEQARAEEREGWRREREVLINRCTVLEQQRDAARAEENEACRVQVGQVRFKRPDIFSRAAFEEVDAAIRARRGCFHE